MDDKKLIKRLKRNDEKALEIIIKTYNPYVAAVIGNQLGGFRNAETIEELASDVFLSLWQNRSSIATYRLRGWLGTVSRNCARTYLRKRNIICKEIDENDMLIIEDNSFEMLEKDIQCNMVGQALDAIDDAHREVLVRYYFYNMTVSDVALAMNLNIETVKSRLKRGREKLRTILERGGYFNEG